MQHLQSVIANFVGLIALIALVAQSGCKTTTSRSLEDTDTQASGSGYSGPPGGPQSAEENKQIWEKYCVGDLSNSAVIPGPNYPAAGVLPESLSEGQAAVQKAATALSAIAPNSFALYSSINAVYKTTTIQKPADVSKSAHEFLTYLCGEFRDRATMVEAKINWLHNFYYLPKVPQQEINPDVPNIWSQVSAASYAPYLDFSEAHFGARQRRAEEQGRIDYGPNFQGIDRPIPPVTICGTKFIFAEYIGKRVAFDSLEAFEQKFAPFQQAHCGAPDSPDNTFYYDFRGDGNFKPNSPESNGMIWHAQSTTLQCASATKVRTPENPHPRHPNQRILLTDKDCSDYFMHPFRSRWNGARAGLAAWILYEDSQRGTFDSSQRQVDILPNFLKSVFTEPHPFEAEDSEGVYRPDWSTRYASPDLAMNSLGSPEETYRHLKNSVDRHTDWYASGYDDQMNQGKQISEAYSPFVASSYEMKASDAFTAPCYTIPCSGEVPARYWKHFMFVFRIPVKSWYHTESIANGERVDFDTNWFDETSLGTTPLAKAEHAFDRLGTALEHELDSILYLHNICSSGEIEGEDGTRCDGTAMPAGG